MSAGNRFSGGPLPDFTGGWARIPFSGNATHYWRQARGGANNRPMEWETPAGLQRMFNSVCGSVQLASTNAKVPALGPGNTALCKHCQRWARVQRIPEPAEAERRTFIEAGR